jgi:hypothetical protein
MDEFADGLQTRYSILGWYGDGSEQVSVSPLLSHG